MRRQRAETGRFRAAKEWTDSGLRASDSDSYGQSTCIYFETAEVLAHARAYCAKNALCSQ